VLDGAFAVLDALAHADEGLGLTALARANGAVRLRDAARHQPAARRDSQMAGLLSARSMRRATRGTRSERFGGGTFGDCTSAVTAPAQRPSDHHTGADTPRLLRISCCSLGELHEFCDQRGATCRNPGQPHFAGRDVGDRRPGDVGALVVGGC
jgi:hypothetical protein